MRLSRVVFGVALAWGTSLPARADDATNDVRCYMVFLELGRSAEAAIKTASLMGGLYYEGKLYGRDSGLDLESRIVAETPAMLGAETFATEARRCHNEMDARARANLQLGKNLEARGKGER